MLVFMKDIFEWCLIIYITNIPLVSWITNQFCSKWHTLSMLSCMLSLQGKHECDSEEMDSHDNCSYLKWTIGTPALSAFRCYEFPLRNRSGRKEGEEMEFIHWDGISQKLSLVAKSILIDTWTASGSKSYYLLCMSISTSWRSRERSSHSPNFHPCLGALIEMQCPYVIVDETRNLILYS